MESTDPLIVVLVVFVVAVLGGVVFVIIVAVIVVAVSVVVVCDVVHKKLDERSLTVFPIFLFAQGFLSWKKSCLSNRFSQFVGLFLLFSLVFYFSSS